MKYLISFLIYLVIFLIVVVEGISRFETAPKVYSSCMRWHSIEMAEYCTCRKNVFIDNRYDEYFKLISSILNGKLPQPYPKEQEWESISGYSQCSIIKDNIIQEKIEQNIENDLRERVLNWLSRDARGLLKEIELTDFDIKKENNNPYGIYIADIEFTISTSVLGIVETKKFQGKLYYSHSGKLVNQSWKKIGSDINAQKAIDGARQIYEFLNN